MSSKQESKWIKQYKKWTFNNLFLVNMFQWISFCEVVKKILSCKLFTQPEINNEHYPNMQSNIYLRLLEFIMKWTVTFGLWSQICCSVTTSVSFQTVQFYKLPVSYLKLNKILWLIMKPYFQFFLFLSLFIFILSTVRLMDLFISSPSSLNIQISDYIGFNVNYSQHQRYKLY